MKSWSPIGGSYSNPYTGNFDGDGHTIGGLNINNTYQGLFFHLGTDGKIENLTVSGTVSGDGTVGGIVMENRGRVENCAFRGSVSGSGFVGGVVGQNNSGGTVTNCYNTGEVSGSGSVGGVVGDNDEGTVENCYNIGAVSGSGNSYVGGVVGYNDDGSVTNCYNTGAVNSSGSGSVGGVVGNNSGEKVEDCYNTGAVSGIGSNSFVGGVVGQNGATVTSCYNTGSVTVTGGSSKGGGVVGQNSGTVTGCYFLQGAAEKGIGNGSGSASELTADEFKNQNSFTNWDFTDTWRISTDKKHPVLQANAEDNALSGTGKQEDPYKIYRAIDLKNFRDIVNGTNDQQKNTSAHAKLMNDISLNPEISYDDDGNITNVKDLTTWDPIGTSSNKYTGTFDGNGKTIENLYINNTSADYQGLFGRVSGTVQNLTVTGSVNGVWSVGGVVGYNNGGTVTSCTFSGSGSVSGVSPVGGVVGNNDNSGSVENCYNTGTGKVSGVWSVGGVVGSNYNASVENCYNIGKVTGSADTSNVGGVVGYNDVTPLGASSVTNCYNTGNISGNNSGGVVGYNVGSVTNCYNTGTVTGNNSGGVVGYNSSSVVGENSGSVENCYNTGNVSGGSKGGVVGYNDGASVANCYYQTGKGATVGVGGANDAESNIIAKTSEQFASGEVANLLGQVWGQTLGSDAYPLLLAFAPEAACVYCASFVTNAEDAAPIADQYTNNSLTLPAAPAREGYTFAGWSDGSTTYNAGASVIISNNTTFAAQWTQITPDPDPTPTPTPDPEPTGPSTGDSTGWADILDELENAENGDQITIDMGDETEVPAEIFATIAGKDVDVTFDLGDVQWSVSGENIPTDTDFTDINLGVALGTSGIPVNVINTITGEVGTVQITLAHNGDFGFTLTLTAPLGKENAGYWANLYHYDESAEAMNFEAAAKIDETGSVTIPFSHASQYAIVIDTHSHARVAVSDIFTDVAPDAWYTAAIQYAYDNGLMTGVSDTEFAPEQTTTRAMIVSILARLENVTTAEAAGFTDVSDEWYATAVNWAASVGVVNGYEDNTFRPNTAITREQLAAILMNYAAYKGEDVSNRADLTSYTDQPSTWAEETMSWAVAEGLISGVTADTLQPQGAATRAQVAAILQRFLSE